MKKTNSKSIPNCLSKYRRLRGLNQKEVTRILGLKNPTVISRWERGNCVPKSVIFLLKLGALYKTSSEALFQDLYRKIKNEVSSEEEKVLKKNRPSKDKSDD